MIHLLKRAGALLCAPVCASMIAAPALAATIPFANGTPYTTGTLSAACSSGTSCAAGSESNYAIPIPGKGFNILLSGTGVASIVLERSFDDGVTWSGIYAGSTQLFTWSYAGTSISAITFDPEFNVYYRLRVVSLTSGTVNYRISQR